MKKTELGQYNQKRYAKPMPTDGVDKTRIDFIVGNIPDNKLKVLDLGCWDGSYALRYKKTSNTVYGIESSESSAKIAKKRGVIVETGDFMTENFFKNTKFDVVVAGEIIEHVFDTDDFLQRIKHLLKPGGIVIVTTPNVASLPRRILLLLGINPSLENRTILDKSAGHIRYFTFKDIEKLFADNHLSIIKSASDVLNFNNDGTLFSTVIPKIYKKFGRSIMVVAINNK
jgi:2-polyprenyl-3-methyl-5-hydroxy-6-metoxy-1,4-benzoquinol methylase